MENIISIFLNVLKLIENNNIPYMIVGSIASTTYGQARLTNDMDLVVELLPSHAMILEKIFPLQDYYCPPPEVIKDEILNCGQFNLIHQSTGLKIDFMIRKNNAHSIEEFKRRLKIPFINSVSVYMATPEDIIIKKLLFYKEGLSHKHLTDIQGILLETEIDHNYLDFWVKNLHLQNEFALVYKKDS